MQCFFLSDEILYIYIEKNPIDVKIILKKKCFVDVWLLNQILIYIKKH